MRRWLWWGLVVAVVAVASHAAVALATPRVIMRVAEDRIADQSGGVNRWLHAPRSTPQNQQVVRSSPDLAYSACAWDVSDGPVLLTAPAWDDYWSLTIYDARTDNVLVRNDRTSAAGASILLVPSGGWSGDVPDSAEVVRAPSIRGVALLRYLAPTDHAFREADQVRSSAVCGSV